MVVSILRKREVIFEIVVMHKFLVFTNFWIVYAIYMFFELGWIDKKKRKKLYSIQDPTQPG